MLNLPVYDLVTGTWLSSENNISLCGTLLEELSDGIEYAVGDVSALKDLAKITELIDAGFDGYTACGASGSRKHGRIFFAKQTTTPFQEYFSSNMNAVNYGSNLTTHCSKIFKQKVRLLVVEDGEWSTGDCHGKISATFSHRICDLNNVAVQFRIALPEFRSLAKGTLVYDYKVSRSKYDIILPTSAFKGNKLKVGEYLCDLVFGLVGKSPISTSEEEELSDDYREVNSSFSITQFLSWKTVEQDILPATIRSCKYLNEIQKDSKKLARYLGETDTTFAAIAANDIYSQLTTHPWMINHIHKTLRGKWLKLATAGGLKWRSSMIMPDENMPDDCCYIPGEINGSEIVVFPYPCRWKYDIRVWTNTYLKKWEKFQGVVVCNTKTALKLGRDFDGDYLMWLPAKEIPNIAKEVKSFGEPRQEAVKPKKNALTGTIGQIAVLSMSNDTGLITSCIAKAQALGCEKVINACVPELQAAVDSLKGATPPDQEKIASSFKLMKHQKVEWLATYKSPDVYVKEPLVGNDRDTVGKLINKVNEYFVPAELRKSKLRVFKDFFADVKVPETWLRRASENQTKFRCSIAAIQNSNVSEDEKGNRIAAVYEMWRHSLDHLSPQQKRCVVAAYWQALHGKAHESKGTAALAFIAGVDVICEQLKTMQFTKLLLTHKNYSSFSEKEKIWTGEKVAARLECRDGYYICHNQEGEIYGSLIVSECPPFLLNCWFEGYIKTAFDKNGYAVRNDLIVSEDF